MIGISTDDLARQAEAIAAMADAYEASLPVCSSCGDRVYPGERFTKIEVNRDEVVLCWYCVNIASKEMEVVR